MNIADKMKTDFENAVNTAIQDWKRATIHSELPFYFLHHFSNADRNDAVLHKERKLVAIDGVNFNAAHDKDAPLFMARPMPLRVGITGTSHGDGKSFFKPNG